MRCSLAALAAVAGMGVCAVSARADGFVSIVPEAGVSGAAKTLDLASLTPDVPQATYGEVATPGGSPQTVTVSGGFSLGKLLVDAGFKNKAFGSAEIVAPSGPPIVLSSAQVTSPFAYGDGPAVVWDDGAGAQFLVPSIPTGKANAGETFAGAGGTVTIDLYSGQPLAIGISAVPQPAIIGKPVQLQASVFGASPGSLSYQWNLGDGSTSSLPSPTHVYTRLGTYNVYMVTSGGDSPGASIIDQVVVGRPPVVPAGTPVGSGSGTGGYGGSGNGQGSGSGRGTGSGRGSAVAHAAGLRHPPKRTAARHATKPRPAGPLVSGIVIADPTQVAADARAAAGAARAARIARRQAALANWMYILIAVLVMLFGGALLEWNNPRAWFGVATSH